MCSSCRRRATKPAIPADALRELGLNQNSSAVRRMTQRLNQVADFKQVAGVCKGSAESTGSSSNSSSGCSSMSAVPSQQQQRPAPQSTSTSSGSRGEVPAPQRKASISRQDERKLVAASSSGRLANNKSVDKANSGSVAIASKRTDQQQRAPVELRRSSCALVGANLGQQQVPTTQNKSAATTQAAQLSRKLSSLPSAPAGGVQPQQQQPARNKNPAKTAGESDEHRRASVAVLAARQTRPQQESTLVRKQSSAFQTNNSSSQQYQPGDGDFAAFYKQHQLIQQQQQQQQPQTMVTASSELDIEQQQQQARRESLAQYYQTPLGATLIPIPSDQIHLRRLSDQSNLVRRSSIIADTIDGFAITRNRSHSNIDTSNHSNYFYESSPLLEQLRQQHVAAGGDHYRFSDDNLNQQQQALEHQQGSRLAVAAYSSQQRRPSDQWVQQQHVAAQKQQQQQQQPSATSRRPEMSSLITSYSQKQQHQQHQQQQQHQQLNQQQRRYSDEIHSDSSSDIEEDFRVPPIGYELDNEQPNEYFAPPRAVGHHQQQQQQLDYLQQMTHNATQGAMPAIPSVSISEFSPNSQHHAASFQTGQVMEVSPMQINSAIEQAIIQQQQQQQQRKMSMSGGGLLNGQHFLLPRRSSSGRVLPKIPGEQSISLLDLPQHGCLLQQSQAGAGSTGSGEQPFSMLDLPTNSATIRRASAPEGQNIKIVVDDIDAACLIGDPSWRLNIHNQNNAHANIAHHHHQFYGKQADFFERLVLYRDDSLDPNTNMARGFGLQVMGGKIDGDERQLQAMINWVLPNGPADKVGLKCGDKIIEWDGKCLLNMTYEQVAEVIESSANIAEILIKPAQNRNHQPNQEHVPTQYIRSQRRMSQQTERDLRKFHQQHQQQPLVHQQQQADLAYSQHLQQQQQPLEPALSAGSIPSSAQYKRSGTGRRLPQIPSNLLQANNNNLLSLSDSIQVKQTLSKSNNSANLIDVPIHHNQQSQSVGELYHKNEAPINYSTQQQLAGLENWSNLRAKSQNEQLNSRYHQSVFDGYHAPTEGNSMNHDEVCGSIGLQVSVDERVCQLEICVLSAINMVQDFSNPKYYVKVRILPESNQFKPCTTLPRADMNWNETLLFQNFPVKEIHKMAMEIGIWVHDEAPSRLSTQIAQPLCEALIPIQSARERNTDFWPLSRPLASPQARRKSLNDLIDSAINNNNSNRRYNEHETNNVAERSQLSAGYQKRSMQTSWFESPAQIRQSSNVQQAVKNHSNETSFHQLPNEINFTRERSASNRNLPDTNKLKAQPRRASDEVASSTSHRLSARVSPAQSRQSISVINVGEALVRPSSRRGSQIGLLKSRELRRNSSNQLQQAASSRQDQQVYSSRADSTSIVTSSVGSDTGAPVGTTPSGRRSSLVGIQSMAGYRSQKNSQSETLADHESPLRRAQKVVPAGCLSSRQTTTPIGGGSAISGESPTTSRRNQREPLSSTSSQTQEATSYQGGSGHTSRRSSMNIDNPPLLQRKDSLAMLTLRKLKRTISLTKGNNEDKNDDNKDSRRSSSSSNRSMELAEDEGVTRRVKSNTELVGRLKLSFIMTKGQLEVDVLCAQNLKFDVDAALGIYAKMYLKGKNKSNKRKTRLVQSSGSPVFKQLIKYDGSLIDNKSLEVSIWQKQGGLKGKVPIGYTEIRMSELNLSQIQFGWYNLRSMASMSNSSIED